MGIMDRDYWRNKYNKNSQYNPKEFRRNKNSSEDDFYNPKEFRKNKNIRLVTASQVRWKKYVYYILIVLFIISAFIVEKGYGLEDLPKAISYIKNKTLNTIEFILNDSKNINENNLTKSTDVITTTKSALAQANKNISITPTHVTIVQTDFRNKIDKLNFNFLYIDNLENAKSYSLSLNYSTSIEKAYGSLGLKPLSCNELYICKVAITTNNWGSINSVLGLNSSYSTKPCEGKFVKNKDSESKIECVGYLGTSIKQTITLNLKKPINFSIEIKEGNKIINSIIDDNEKPIIISEFHMPTQFNINKSLTTSIYLGEKISGCDKLKPLHIAMDFIKSSNQNEIGSSNVSDMLNEEYPCRDSSKSKIIKDKIIMKIQS